MASGGAPIKIRIVKGSESRHGAVRGLRQRMGAGSLRDKIDVDANYKRMVTYGCIPENARAVHLGVASHNLFDIAYAMLLRAENAVEQ